ncbi:MAG TPA: HNH endonuclease signature motif containing protein [bacterium]|nr:HNH endonuclease signature motif containing protein [bacterium]HPQ65758.1 HNH endonuclease signature motif containing protein [bacterium]
MNDRIFSDAIQYKVIVENLEKNNGQLRCEICKKEITTKINCHFDHIVPYSKGGKSVLSNCQILCAECNLKKNDKEVHDFILEGKAKKFLQGEPINNIDDLVEKDAALNEKELTKEDFDKIIKIFISQRGTLKKVDFFRDRNHLPSFSYVLKFYGGLTELKEKFGLEVGLPKWDRDSIRSALEKYISEQGNFFQKDLTKQNRLPSLPCVLVHYPELKSFSEVKEFFGLKRTRINWTKELAINAGEIFIQKNGKITQKDLCSKNDLPTSNVISRLFKSLAEYQKIIGAEITSRNEFVTIEDISCAVDKYFKGKDRIIKSRSIFFKSFPYSESTILKRFEYFEKFCTRYDINILNTKKGKFTKQEVDQLIIDFIKSGKPMPTSSKNLTKNGLPSLAVLLRFYESWKEPFMYYSKMYEKVK